MTQAVAKTRTRTAKKKVVKKVAAKKAQTKASTKAKTTTPATRAKSTSPQKTTKAATTQAQVTQAAAQTMTKKRTGEDIEQIWKTYKTTADPNLRNILIEKYLPLVRYISERLLVTLPKSIELDDLASAGIFGLMDAIDGFDLERGIKFKTYCTTRIRGSILDELRSQDWVPRLVRLKANQIDKAYKALEAELGREPTEFEMANKLNISLNELNTLKAESSPKTIYSLSEKWDENEDDKMVEKVDLIEDRRSIDPADVMNQKDTLDLITRNLSKKERLIVIMYYYEGLTMKEIGEILDLTESRVCQIHSNVMTRLKGQLSKLRVRILESK
ncbi:MAG: FliA/WhiG family RNA polymerase sigma factor [Planctomycetota bacterium]